MPISRSSHSHWIFLPDAEGPRELTRVWESRPWRYSLQPLISGVYMSLPDAQLMPTHQSSVASCLPNFLSPAFHTHFPPQPAQTAPPGSSSPASLRCPCTTRTLRQEGSREQSRPDGAIVSFSPIRSYSNALVAQDVFSPWCSLWQERRTYFGSLQHLPWYWSLRPSAAENSTGWNVGLWQCPCSLLSLEAHPRIVTTDTVPSKSSTVPAMF